MQFQPQMLVRADADSIVSACSLCSEEAGDRLTGSALYHAASTLIQTCRMSFSVAIIHLYGTPLFSCL